MVNDITIISGIIIFFIALGSILPVIESDFGGASTSPNINGLVDNVSSGAQQMENTSINPTWLNPTGSLSIFSIMLSVVKMFFWTFGSIPFWIDLIVFIPLRIILVLTIARNVWIGGGS